MLENKTTSDKGRLKKEFLADTRATNFLKSLAYRRKSSISPNMVMLHK